MNQWDDKYDGNYQSDDPNTINGSQLYRMIRNRDDLSMDKYSAAAQKYGWHRGNDFKLRETTVEGQQGNTADIKDSTNGTGVNFASDVPSGLRDLYLRYRRWYKDSRDYNNPDGRSLPEYVTDMMGAGGGSKFVKRGGQVHLVEKETKSEPSSDSTTGGSDTGNSTTSSSGSSDSTPESPESVPSPSDLLDATQGAGPLDTIKKGMQAATGQTSGSSSTSSSSDSGSSTDSSSTSSSSGGSGIVDTIKKATQGGVPDTKQEADQKAQDIVDPSVFPTEAASHSGSSGTVGGDGPVEPPAPDKSSTDMTQTNNNNNNSDSGGLTQKQMLMAGGAAAIAVVIGR